MFSVKSGNPLSLIMGVPNNDKNPKINKWGGTIFWNCRVANISILIIVKLNLLI